MILAEAIRRIHNGESMAYLFRNIAMDDWGDTHVHLGYIINKHIHWGPRIQFTLSSAFKLLQFVFLLILRE